jgi:peptidoglycan/LPS O-acetylase OafA/YrhL
MSDRPFRRDIAGLRALAVLPIVLFHAGVERMAGGFVGVDIFFVISGFVITRSIIGDLQSDRFSMVEFCRCTSTTDI